MAEPTHQQIAVHFRTDRHILTMFLSVVMSEA
jgi:hypothetical protein